MANSKLWLPIKAHIDCIDGSMPAVHHYTNLSGALGILESGRIWFTERAHLNDRSEVRHGMDIAESVLAAQGRPNDASRLKSSAAGVFCDFRFFSASFSFTYDDPHQWRKYGDNGRGVCLSFKAAAFNKPKAFIDSLIPDNPTAFVCPISYGSDRLRSVITGIIECWDGDNIQELTDHVFMISAMFKSDSWKQEEEYRFFIHHPYTRISKSTYYKTRLQDKRAIEYLDLPIRGWNSPDELPVYRVCCGLAAPSETEARLVELMRAIKPSPREGILRSGPKGF